MVDTDLIRTAAWSVMAVAAAIVFMTWSKSPVRLPLPPGNTRRWLSSVPILATVSILGILSTWYSDCSHRRLLTALSAVAIVLCGGLLVMHSHLLHRERAVHRTVLVVICLAWSICGVLAVTATATQRIATQRMEEAYERTPLTLWYLDSAGQKVKPDRAIYRRSGMPTHFRADMDECHDVMPRLSHEPNIGRLVNGTYFTPKTIAEEQQVTIFARAPLHKDTRSAIVVLVPDEPDTTRDQYPETDDNGRPALFDVIVISNEHAWVYESDEHIVKRKSGDDTAIPVCQSVARLARAHAFDAYTDIIAVGTASREGTEVEEDDRAARRSQRVAEWINATLGETAGKKRVYAMNLGKYRPDLQDSGPRTTTDTAGERLVVIIGVIRGGAIDLESALRRVFNKHRHNAVLNQLATHYPGRKLVLYTSEAGGDCASR